MCSHAKDDRYPSGGTFVAIHDIRAPVGTDKVSDAEVFSVDAGCTPGTRLDKGSASSATSANGTDVSVTITRFDADLGEVRGSLDLRGLLLHPALRRLGRLRTIADLRIARPSTRASRPLR